MRRLSRNALYSCALALSLIAASALQAKPPAKKGSGSKGSGSGDDNSAFAAHEVSSKAAAIKKTPLHVKPATAHGKFIIKTPIKHVPIPIAHFRKLGDKNGNVKLPNGKTVKIGDWHAATNHLEQTLNSIGHSLHHDKGKKTRIGNHDTGHAELARHHAAIASQHKKVAHTKKTAADHAAFSTAMATLRKDNASSTTTTKNKAGGTTTVHASTSRGVGNSAVDELNQAAGMASGVAVKAETAKDFNLAAGDPKHFSAYLKGRAALQGDATYTGLKANINAGGSLMGHSQDILLVTAEFTAKKSGELSARVDASIAKKSIYSLAKTATKNWSKTERISKSVDVSATVPIFSLAIVTVMAKIGVSGSAGVDYGVALGPGIVGGHVTPFVDTQVYVQCSIQGPLDIAEAGAEGKLTLLKDELELAASASLVPAEVKGKGVQWGVYTKLTLHNSMNMLSGDISAFLKVHYPCLDPWPKICSKHLEYHLFGWAGKQVDGELFSQSKFISLGIPATKMSM